MSSERDKVFSGLLWTYAERTLAQLISLIVTVVLARLVSTDEHGVITAASVFIVLADTFAVSGMGNALIQKKDADQLDYSTVFYFNIGFSVIVYLVFFLGAGPIARFYRMPLLEPVLRVVSLRIPIAAVNSVQQAYVSQKLQFKKFFWATLAGTIISGVVGVVLAYNQMGVWALVTQYLLNAFVDTIVLWYTVRWRPILRYSHKRMKQLFSFGWKVLVTSILITLYSNVQDLIIGKKFSSSDLAYSNKGRQFPSIIATNINTSINKVLFPVLSKKQEHINQIKDLVRKSIGIGTYVLTPILLGLSVVAEEFVIVVLTEKWISCVPYLKIMCFVFMLQPIQTVSIQAFKALGRSDLYLKLELLKKIAGVVILFVSVFCFDSVLAIFIGCLVAEVFSTIVNIPANKKVLGYSFFEQIKDVFGSLAMSGVMCGVVSIVGTLDINVFLCLVIQIIVGIGVYIVMSILFHNRNFTYLLQTINTLIRKKHV